MVILWRRLGLGHVVIAMETFGTALWVRTHHILSYTISNHIILIKYSQDNLGAIEASTQEGIDFLGKIGEFAKRRAHLEQEYAKSLGKLSEQFQDTLGKKKSGKGSKSAEPSPM